MYLPHPFLHGGILHTWLLCSSPPCTQWSSLFDLFSATLDHLPVGSGMHLLPIGIELFLLEERLTFQLSEGLQDRWVDVWEVPMGV